MPLLVAAPDKFRGTASAATVAAAAARAGRRAGWRAREVPLADGGEGTLEVLASRRGARLRRAVVPGPLGAPVDAGWLVLGDTSTLSLPPPIVPGDDPTAVVEAALAAGRALLPSPAGDDPVRASSAGVGALVVEAISAGARQVVVAVGGTATTDGGAGALEAIDRAGGLGHARVVVAHDVVTTFLDAAREFAPQKGASAAQVAALTTRLEDLADRYRDERGTDVTARAGTGAGGGLAGGLMSAGAALVPGFAFVAAVVGLERHLAGADLVMTGEGRLDRTSAEGKVVGGVLGAGDGRLPVLCVVGERAPGAEDAWARRPGTVAVVSLVEEYGRRRALEETTPCVAAVVEAHCRRRSGAAEAGASHR